MLKLEGENVIFEQNFIKKMESCNEEPATENSESQLKASCSQKTGRTSPDIVDTTSLDAMFALICRQKDAYFRSEQRDSPDLTESEKLEILSKLYATKPGTFLARYGRFLSQEFAVRFEKWKDDYEVAFYLEEICSKTAAVPVNDLRLCDKSPAKSRGTKTQNRRYEAMRKLTEEGKFFSDEQMRQRDPLLYDHMVGQYLTAQERGCLYPRNARSGTLTGMFMDLLDTKETALKRKAQESCQSDYWANSEHKLLKHASKRMRGFYKKKDTDNVEMTSKKMRELLRFGDLEIGKEQVEEEEEVETDQESSGSDSDCHDMSDNEMDMLVSEDCPHPSDITVSEREQLREEFIGHMEQRFLSGIESDWVDYDQIDNDSNNDPIKLMQQDAEDAYFDSEEPAMVSSREILSSTLN